MKGLGESGTATIDENGQLSSVSSLKDDARFKTNCHGVTFAQGEVWINPRDVETILTEEYDVTDTPQVGDAVVYRNPDTGEAEHSATVTDVDDKGSVVGVSGLGGLAMKSQTRPPTPGTGGAWYDPKSKPQYYTRRNDKRSQDQRRKDADRVRDYEKN